MRVLISVVSGGLIGGRTQVSSFRLIFYGLLAVSSILSAVGCFALSRKQRSWLALVSGMPFVAIFMVLVVYLVPFVGIASIYPNPYPTWLSFVTELIPSLFFPASILWGATLLIIGRKMGVSGLSRAAGSAFIASGVFGMLLLQLVLYFGFDVWFVVIGWLYAAGALMTAIIFFTDHLRRSQSLH